MSANGYGDAFMFSNSTYQRMANFDAFHNRHLISVPRIFTSFASAVGALRGTQYIDAERETINL